MQHATLIKLRQPLPAYGSSISRAGVCCFMNRYDRYPGDYLRDTLTLTLAQDGAYTRLLDYYYSKEHPIPDSEACMVTRARSKDDEDITHWVLRRFFRSEETGTELVWVHDRADREIAKARPRIQAARENGKRGGRPRKDSGNKDQSTGDKKPSGKPGGKPKQEPNENPGRKLPSPSPSDLTPVVPKGDSRSGGLRPQVIEVFEFWKAERKKPGTVVLGTKRQRKVIARLKEGRTVDEIKQAIRNVELSDHHSGRAGKGTWDDLELICRDETKFDYFLGLSQHPLRGGKPTTQLIDDPPLEPWQLPQSGGSR